MKKVGYYFIKDFRRVEVILTFRNFRGMENVSEMKYAFIRKEGTTDLWKQIDMKDPKNKFENRSKISSDEVIDTINSLIGYQTELMKDVDKPYESVEISFNKEK